MGKNSWALPLGTSFAKQFTALMGNQLGFCIQSGQKSLAKSIATYVHNYVWPMMSANVPREFDDIQQLGKELSFIAGKSVGTSCLFTCHC